MPFLPLFTCGDYIPTTPLRHFLSAGHAKHGAAPTGAFDWTRSCQSGAWGGVCQWHTPPHDRADRRDPQQAASEYRKRYSDALLATMVTFPKRGRNWPPYTAAHTQATMGGNRTDNALLELSRSLCKLSAGPPIAAFDLRRLKSGNIPHIHVTKQAESVVGSGGPRLKL